MSRNLFGTDGVRGIAGEYPLNDEGLVAMGRAVGTVFAQPDEQIVVACDTRESSKRFVEQIAAGLQAVGIKVIFAGVMPTPGLAHITAAHEEFVAGVMITASHNPYEFNGVKIFDRNGGKLPDESEETVNDLIENGTPDRGAGSYSEEDLTDEYVDFLVASAGGLRFDGLKIALDAANGAAFAVGEEALKQLGAEVIMMGNTPDGKNINDHCGATDVAALNALVERENCDVGIAVDGDADRLIMVDDKGRECDGDHLLYLLAVAYNFPHVVATVMSNLGLEQALTSQGITLERTAVGDRYVLERMVEAGLPIGGEQSGHIILSQLTTTGDGLLAAIQVLKALKTIDKPLSAWRDEITTYPQALVNIHVEDKSRLSNPDIQEFIAKETAALGDTGRLLIRPSGTEPLARVMVEGEDADNKARDIAARLEELLR